MIRVRKVRNIPLIILGILAIMFLSCILVFAQTSNDATRFTDREKDGLLGPVKSIALFFDGKSTSIWTKSYRKDGSREMIEYTIANTNFLIQTCDNKGRIIKSEILNNGSRELSSYRTYDNVNHTTTIYFQDADHLPKEQSDKLTVDGQPLETKYYSPTGEYIGNTLYEYNKNGLLLVMAKYSRKGIAFETYKTSYDLNGRVVEQNCYKDQTDDISIQPFLAYKECYSYDTKGRLIEKRIYSGDRQELSQLTTYSDYDKYGNATKQTDVKREPYLDKYFPPIKLMKYEYFE